MERFETEILKLTDFFKQTVMDVKKDFNDDIRSMQKMRARDKSDQDSKFIEQGGQIQTFEAEHN